MEEFSRRLRERILAKHDTLSAFCKRLGIRQERLNHWLGPRQSEPGYEMLLRICRELDTHPNYLLGISDEPSPIYRDEASRLSALEREVGPMRENFARSRTR